MMNNKCTSPIPAPPNEVMDIKVYLITLIYVLGHSNTYF